MCVCGQSSEDGRGGKGYTMGGTVCLERDECGGGEALVHQIVLLNVD